MGVLRTESPYYFVMVIGTLALPDSRSPAGISPRTPYRICLRLDNSFAFYGFLMTVSRRA